MLQDRIDVSKSSGPDKLPGRLLQCRAKEITPVVIITNQKSNPIGKRTINR